MERKRFSEEQPKDRVMPEKILNPLYAAAFKCIASSCEDTCCSGWQITVDRDTYDRYQNFPEECMRQRLRRHIVLNNGGRYAEDYAEIKLIASTCPLLTLDRLCSVQQAGGEESLSMTCANFPRNYNLVNGQLELALDLSCPEAARLALLNPGRMLFAETGCGAAARTGDIPVIDAADTALPGGIHLRFIEIRQAVLDILQDRSHPLEDRLVILGKYCVQLGDAPPDPGSPCDTAALLKTLAILIEYRIKTEAASPRFSECVGQFNLGLQYTNYMSERDLFRNYLQAKSHFYDGFMEKHEYVLENYFVNYVFKTLFPLGPQKCSYKKRLYMHPKSIFEEYMLLVIQYAMMKSLLVGMAGYWGEGFGTNHALKLIQSFAKNVDHDISYQQRILQFFWENDMMNLACAETLIGN
jgi:lysine-N-methylase